MYENIVSAHEKVAEISVPVKAKIKQHVPWENENIIAKREMVKNAYEVCLRRNTKSRAAKLEKAKQDLQECYDREQEKYVNEKIHAITDAIQHQKSGLAWETVNEFTRRKGTNKGRIKAKSPEERVGKWKTHFSNLLGQTPSVTIKLTASMIHEPLPINTDNITMEELVKSIKGFKNNKANGFDNILIEVWKTDTLSQQLLDICKKTLNGDGPNIWVKSGIIPLPNKGDLGDTGNYRGISLTAKAAKIYNKILLDRIRSHLDPLLRVNQFCKETPSHLSYLS